jgi:hypothetical protein
MLLSHRCITRLIVASLLLVPAARATAGSLLPNPANGLSPAILGENEVELIPNPVGYLSPALGCPWLLPAAQNPEEPYNTDPQNLWTFTYAANFSGTFNGTNYAATIGAGRGGANFQMAYTPGMGDPAGANVRWMQVIDINTVGWNAIKGLGLPMTVYAVQGTGLNGIPVGTYAFLDNAGPGPGNGTAPIDPWYGWLTVTKPGDITTSTAANSEGFLDTPSLPFVPGLILEFQTFVVSDTMTANGMGGMNNAVSIYGGAWWGFQDVVVPEPSSWVLLIIGSGAAVLANRRALRRRFRSSA